MQVNSKDDILSAKKLLFPGVGSYGQAMDELLKQGYVEALKEYIQARTSTPNPLTTHINHISVLFDYCSHSAPVRCIR